MRNYDVRELKKLTAMDFYPFIDPVADKAAAIYQLFGWDFNKKWLKEEGQPSQTIEELIEECLKQLREGKTEANCATGGLKVEMCIGENNEILLEVLFELGEW